MMVTVGSYQAMCNMYRVFISFDRRSLPEKVRPAPAAARAARPGCARARGARARRCRSLPASGP
jgi:hypothetical protein